MFLRNICLATNLGGATLLCPCYSFKKISICRLLFRPFYYPPTKFAQGNVFTGVCLSTGEGVGMVPGPFRGNMSRGGWVCSGV